MFLSKTVFIKILITYFIFAVFSVNNTIASENNYESYNHGSHPKKTFERIIEGVAVTGFNNVIGRPFYDWGEPFGTFGFPTFGVYNPYGTEPLPLDEMTPTSAILATSVPPEFLVLAGKTRDDVNPEWENVPLRDVPVNVDFAFVERKPLKGVLSADPFEPGQAEPVNPITLGQWMRAKGVAKIVCRGDIAIIKLRLRHFIPNRMYAVWATLGGENLSTFPIGGTPNVFITNEYGNAEFKRAIKFCPLEVKEGDRPLLVLNVQYYSNHQNYGAVPEPVQVDGFWVGLVTHNHMQFPVTVELLD